MKCVRCGYCCKNYMVMIVDDPKKGLSKDNLILQRGDGTPCKHLKGDSPGNYSCELHDYHWYKKTPCWAHGQLEYQDSICRIGEYILNNNIL